ncbi:MULTISPECIES: hypothetical protein [unclassified Burkholderia]|uniref:hypothetical protein n=1 Tax=Burkholderia sp. IMCC1007 TaxID=3004104 RepID=UPI0016268BAD
MREACLAGLGLALLTHLDVRKNLRTALWRLTLDDAQPQHLSAWALLPLRKYVPLRVRVFLQALQRLLAGG